MLLSEVNPVYVKRKLKYIQLNISTTDFYNTPLKSYIYSIGGDPLENQEVITGTEVPTSLLSAGSYEIIYKSTDEDSNFITATRTLIVETNRILPTMELSGDNPARLIRRLDYTDPGIISKDFYQNDLTSYIISISGEIVNQLVIPDMTITTSLLPLGDHNIIYSCTDEDSNVQTYTRVLRVEKNTTLPTMTLIVGTTTITRGFNYTEPGINSKDFYNTPLKSYLYSIDGGVLTLIEQIEVIDSSTSILTAGLAIGSHNIIYTCKDSDDNIGFVTRTINIARNTIIPTMILTGLDPAPVTYRLAYTDPGVTSRDFYNTLLPTYIMSINTTSFSELTKRLVSTGTTLLTTADTSGLAIGTYNITYKTTDSDLLSKTIIRKLKVELNTQPPTMIIFGDTRVNLVIGVNYGDPGVLSKTVYDETIITYIYSIDGVLKTNLRVKSTGNIEDYTFLTLTGTSSLPLGDRIIRYKATDYQGNVNYITRTLNIVANTTKPTITLVGPQKLFFRQGTSYTDTSATAIDLYGRSVLVYITSIAGVSVTETVLATSKPYMSAIENLTPGTYFIEYFARDLDLNEKTVTRSITIDALYTAYVIDTTSSNVYDSTSKTYPTEITLDTGINTSTIMWSNYENQKYTFNPIINTNTTSGLSCFVWLNSRQINTAWTIGANTLSKMDVWSPWCFVFKVKNQNSSGTGLFILFDPDPTSWFRKTTNCSPVISCFAMNELSGGIFNFTSDGFNNVDTNVPMGIYRQFVTLTGTIVPPLVSGDDNPWTTNSGRMYQRLINNPDFMVAGCFVKISKTDRWTTCIEIIKPDSTDTSKSITLFKLLRTGAVRYGLLPFSIYQSGTNYHKYYDGFLSSMTDISYSDMIGPYGFPSTNNFW